MKHLWIVGILLFCNSAALLAQDGGESWSLQRCIEYAYQNSLQVQQADLAVQQAKLGQKQAYWAQFPTANATFRHGFNFGRSIDVTSYSYVNQITQSSSLGLNLNQPIFQGLQIRNGIIQSKVDVAAAQKDVEQTRNDISLQVAQIYLSILLAKESVQVLTEQAKVTKAQLEQTKKLIDAGVVADNSKYDLIAQTARDQENIVNAQNSLQLAFVNLKTLMNLDVSESIDIEPIQDFEVDEVTNLATLEAVYEEAVNTQPNIAASKLRENSAKIGVDIAKGGLYPSINLYGGLQTNFSGAARSFDGVDSSYFPVGGAVIATQDPVLVQIPNFQARRGDVIPYFSQLGDNISGNVGINISVPIFNGMRTRISIQRAELAVKSAELATKQQEVALKGNIDRALNDVKAAAERYKAAQNTVTATRMSVQNTRKRFDLGVVNSFELTSVQNILISSESNLLQAKYDYLFKLKILDFYKGTAITIE